MTSLTLFEELFYQALRIRLIEERIIEYYPSQKIQSPVHLSIGQEAIAVGVCHALRREDLLFPTYRGHAFVLAKGADLKRFFAELYGKADGEAGGKAGSMHLMAPDQGVMPASAVVASTIPCGTGAALASRLRGLDQVVVAIFGDGATEEGVYHESLNFASLFPCPLIFLCENNGLAVHARQNERQRYRIAEHARQYGIEVTHIPDSRNPQTVFEQFQPVVQATRESGRPHFVLIDTFRYKEHVGPGEDFTAGYRERTEMERWAADDPLTTRTDLLEKFRPALLAEIDAAIAFAEASPWPDSDTLLQHVI